MSPLVVSFIKKYQLSKGFELYPRIFTGIPLATKPGFVSDKIFFGPGLAARYSRGKFSAELNGILSFFKSPSWLVPEEVRSHLFLLKLRAGYGRFFAGVVLKTSPFLDGDHSHMARQIFLFYRISRKLEVGVVEDIWPFDTTPDIHFFVRYKFL